MSDDSPRIVREEKAGQWGLYHPDENVIETYDGADKKEIPDIGRIGEIWNDAGEGDLAASIEEDIRDVREDVETLREQDLTEEQRDELARLTSRLESMENTLDLVEEVQDA